MKWENKIFRIFDFNVKSLGFEVQGLLPSKLNGFRLEVHRDHAVFTVADRYRVHSISSGRDA
jgi:hypothetical protein